MNTANSINTKVNCRLVISYLKVCFELLGMVSRKNEANVMTKNLIDLVVGGFTFWLVGFGLAFGPNNHGTNAMSGAGDHFFWNRVDVNKKGHVHTKFFFQLSFATTSTTTISGVFHLALFNIRNIPCRIIQCLSVRGKSKALMYNRSYAWQ